MRVIVTGGTGLIGRALTMYLDARGDEVIVTSRRPRRSADWPAGVGLVKWDGETVTSLVPVLAGAHAVVHLAGEGIAARRWTAERKELIRESRTRSTAALVEAFARVGKRPSVLLQGSAVGYYGSRGDEELDESSDVGEGFLADVCYDWEAAGSPVEDLGVRRVLLRTGVVLAKEGGALPRMAMPFRLFGGGPVGNGRQWVPWIHLADEVGAIAFLLDAEHTNGVFNLTAPECVTNRTLSRAIGRVLHRPSFVPAPAFAMKLALGEMAELLLNSQKVLSSALVSAGYTFRFPAVEAALRDLLGRSQ